MGQAGAVERSSVKECADLDLESSTISGACRSLYPTDAASRIICTADQKKTVKYLALTTSCTRAIKAAEKKEEERRKAEREKIEKAENWSCLYFYDKVGVEGGEKQCQDFKKSLFKETVKSVGQARSRCYGICDRRNTEAKRCVFIETLSCDDILSDKTFSVPTKEFEGFASQGIGLGSLAKLKTKNSVPALVGVIIRIAMSFLGTVALLVFIYGGLMWMTARGNSERTGKAMKTIMWGALGLILILSSYALTDFVLQGFIPTTEELNTR